MLNSFVRTGVAAGILLASTVASFADITGGYFAFGRNVNGSTYEGTANVVRNSNGSYTVNWSVGSSYSGTGILNGDVFTVEWGAAHPIYYVVTPDGDLQGTWADGMALDLLSREAR